MQRRAWFNLIAIAISLVVAACGGGGDSQMPSNLYSALSGSTGAIRSSPRSDESLSSSPAINPPGVAIAIDDNAGTGSRGALFRVDASTGARILLSDFGDAAQGPLGADPIGVAVDPTGQILVVDDNAGTATLGALFGVDATTGLRTLLSDFNNPAQGPLGFSPMGVALDSSGDILVADTNAGTALLGALFRVERATGVRVVLSDFGNSAQGPLGNTPSRLTVSASGSILVIDSDAGNGLSGALFQVDPLTGARVLLSDFGNAAQGPLGITPVDLALEPSGEILVIDENAGTATRGALFRVDPSTGARTLVSDFGNSAQGPLGFDPSGLALETSGHALVIDFSGGVAFNGALFRVDPTTGVRTVMSDFGNAAEGPLGMDPFGVALLPSAADPTDKSRCKNGGWAALRFKNQGQCIRFVQREKDSRIAK